MFLGYTGAIKNGGTSMCVFQVHQLATTNNTVPAWTGCVEATFTWVHMGKVEPVAGGLKDIEGATPNLAMSIHLTPS